ncbi:unnamed protein product, partial [Microthlaspi erraticum]
MPAETLCTDVAAGYYKSDVKSEDGSSETSLRDDFRSPELFHREERGFGRGDELRANMKGGFE